METIKRYSMRMGNMGGDMARNAILNPSKSVPKRFLNTPGRQKLKMVLRVFGMVFFSMTVMVVLGSVVSMIWSSSLVNSSNPVSFPVGVIFLINLVNIMGMFAELAGDNGGVNWFARGFLLSIVSLGSCFLILSFAGLF